MSYGKSYVREKKKKLLENDMLSENESDLILFQKLYYKTGHCYHKMHKRNLAFITEGAKKIPCHQNV